MFSSLLDIYAFVGTSIQDGWNSFYGNRADYYLCAVLQNLRDRIPPTTEPRNHLLQRALRKSYLEDVLLLYSERLREIQLIKFKNQFIPTNLEEIRLWNLYQ